MRPATALAERHGEARTRDASPDVAPEQHGFVAELARAAAPRGEDDLEPSSAFEALAPAAVFLLVAICIGTDFVADVATGETTGHLAGMAVGTALSLGGLGLMLRIIARSRARSRHLAEALDRTRADAVHWREQSAQTLAGLGSLIDAQLAEWGLTPSERGVALLLLKGLSLKEIAAARGAAEPTVRQQAQSIYRKANLSGRAELSAFFLEDLLLPQRPANETPAPVARALSDAR